MPAFKPVHASAKCRLRLVFGDKRPDPNRLGPDALERLVNRCAANALVLATGTGNYSRLGKLLADRLVTSSPEYFDIDPSAYFTRLANGKPQIRTPAVGRPNKNLALFLNALGDEAMDEFDIVTSWVIWELIHPSPLTTIDLSFMRARLPAGANFVEFMKLVSAEHPQHELAATLLQAAQNAVPGPLVAMTALWQFLRQASLDADLPRYALLYDTWTRMRVHLEQVPVLRRAVNDLYEFTAVWFGQVEIELAAGQTLALDREEYFRSVRRVVALLRYLPNDARGIASVWRAFRYKGLRVRAVADLDAFRIEPGTLRMTDWDMRWLNKKAKPLPELPRTRPSDSGGVVRATE
jgi:hypothetical protein